LESIIGYYYPTPKNGMVKDFYARMGFEKMDEDDKGNTTWKLDLNGYEPKNPAIVIQR
jgi:predicted enzyme involved in methoxymalonyl-ACP biosynthesis